MLGIRGKALSGLLAPALLASVFCGSPPVATRPVSVAPSNPPAAADVRDARWAPLLDDVEKRTFEFFWERANPKNGLVPDRWPSPSFSSIAAVGFALTAYPIGVERGYVTR